MLPSLIKSRLVQFEKTRRKVGCRQPISRFVFSNCTSQEFMNERENVMNERREGRKGMKAVEKGWNKKIGTKKERKYEGRKCP